MTKLTILSLDDNSFLEGYRFSSCFLININPFNCFRSIDPILSKKALLLTISLFESFLSGDDTSLEEAFIKVIPTKGKASIFLTS